MKLRILAPLFVFLFIFVVSPTKVNAEGKAGTLGLGGQMSLTGISGLSGTFQGSSFYVDGLFGFRSFGDDDVLQIAGRFWFPIHLGDNSDFSVGGGLGVTDQNETDVNIEAGAKIRMFFTPNVALSTELGLAYVVTGGDNTPNLFSLGGELFGAAGITYFFE